MTRHGPPSCMSGSKDLSFCRITETCGFCMATGRLSLFDADWKRNVQILRFAQDDNEAKCVILSGVKDLSFCHVTETCGFCMETGRLSLFNADWKRNVRILLFAQDDDEAERVILSEAKDLSFCRITETWGVCMATGRLSLFDADWKRNVQILRFAQDDNEAERVILNKAKDLYETNSDHIPIIPQLSVKSLLF